MLDAEVSGEEGIGIGKRAHGDVLGSPASDSRDGEQAGADLCAVTAGVDDNFLLRERASERLERAATAQGAVQRRGVGTGKGVRCGEKVGERAVWGREWLAEGKREAPGGGAGGGDGYLLSEDGPYRQLRAFGGTGYSQAGRFLEK